MGLKKIYLILFTFLTASLVPAKELTILIKMIPAQEEFFKETILKSFEAKCGCKINVSHFSDDWGLTGQLKEEGASIDVVKVPMSMAHPLAVEGLIQPLKLIAGSSLKKISRKYFLMNLAKVNKKIYYLPRKFETRIMVYLDSKVQDAVANWGTVKPEIEKALFAGGSRLPAGYALKKKPSTWDYLDLYVAGTYWASLSIDKIGRIAHRGKDYNGTAVGLMDRAFQMGASKKDILNPGSAPFTEVLRWESLYAAAGVYNTKSWEQGWSGGDIWKGFQSGDVYLSWMTQLDCYALMGSLGEKYITQPEDFKVAPNPRSVHLNSDKKGSRSISTGGWLWGVGHKSANPKLALELIQHITSYENQVSETQKFGMIPVKKEILGKSKIQFKESWKNNVFNTSFKQLKLNKKTTLPYSNDFNSLARKYVAIWKEVVTKSSDKALTESEVQEIQKKHK